MVIWYGGPGHESAGKLAAWLGLKGIDISLVCKTSKLPPQPTDAFVVSWGRKLPVVYQAGLNNRAPIGNKLVELTMLMGAQVPVPGLSLTPHEGWLPRKHQHHDGDDLLNPDNTGNFYVEPILTTHEFRVNVFEGKVVRTGLKQPKPGAQQKTVNTSVGIIPIRTGAHGWTWTYQQAPLDATNTHRAPMRDIAIKAVKTLGYDFGAVDVGYRPNGSWVVFEVNTAPALEGDDLERYGQLILNYGKERGYFGPNHH